MKTWADKSRDQLAALKTDAESRRRQHDDMRQPLRVKLDRIIRELPPERAQAGLSIQFFAEQISPRWRGKCANPRDIGIALRAMGWTRVRRWRADLGGFRALWFPPADQPRAEAPKRPPESPEQPTPTNPLAELFSFQ
jgi:hypothetical protein